MLRLVTLSAVLIAGFATSAQSQNFCGNRDVMVAKLAEEFKENPMAVGMVDKNAVLEIFVSPEGSWTILATGTDGTSCVISAGEGWESKTLVLGSDV